MATRFAKAIRDFASWLAALLLVGSCAAGLYFFLRADEDLRQRVERTIGELFPHHSVRITSARYVSGEGIHLRGISVVETDVFGILRDPEITCKEAVLHCNLSVQQVLNEQIQIRQVDVRGLIIKALRDEQGNWNLTKLKPRKAGSMRPSVHIENARIDLSDGAASTSVSIRQANFLPATDNEPRRDYLFDIQGQSELFKQAAVRGWFNTKTNEWCIEHGNVDQLDVRTELTQLLPASIRNSIREVDAVRALVQIQDFGFWMQANQRPQFWMQASLTQGRLDHARLPYTVDDVRIKSIRCANYGPQAGWRLADVDAKFDSAQFHFSEVTAPSLGIEGLVARGQVEELMLKPELRSLLPSKQQLLWDKYLPHGLVDADFQIQRRDGRWRFQSDTTFRDVSLLCAYFKYPLIHSSGLIKFRQDQTLEVDLWAAIDNSGRRPIKIDADIKRPGKQFFGWVKIRSGWLPWDERINQALPRGAQKFVHDLGVRGEITLLADLTREPNERLKKDVKIHVRQGSLRHRAFPYPLNHVQGRMHVTDDLWTFEDFVGRNDSCRVEFNGTWQPLAAPTVSGSRPGQTKMVIVAQDIPCDNELRNALPTGPQQIWKSLRPRGQLNHVRIDLAHRTGMAKPEIDVLVRQHERDSGPEQIDLEIQPAWFPLRMRRATGVVHYKNDGSFVLHNLRAEHGPRQHQVVLQIPDIQRNNEVIPGGSGVIRRDGSWDVQLHRVLADGVDMTPEVLDAIPAGLASGLRQLQFTGKLSFESQMRFARGPGANAITHAAWSSGVTIDNGNLRVGKYPLHNVFGEVRVVGHKDAAGWRSSGQAYLDSVNCRGVYLEGIRSPWSIDSRELRFGAEVQPELQEDPSRVANHLTGRVFDGNLQADGAIGLSADNPFRVRLALVDFDAATVSRDLAMPSRITGRGVARLNLSGSAEGTHTLDGRGAIELDDAKLAKLPAIIEILNYLKVRNAPPDVFSSGKMAFDLKGPYLNLSQFDLHGESLSLKGKGWLALDRRLDIAFYSILGGEKSWRKSIIPMLGQASQQVLEIRVQGSIDRPKWSRNVLPGLNELFLGQQRGAEGPARQR